MIYLNTYVCTTCEHLLKWAQHTNTCCNTCAALRWTRCWQVLTSSTLQWAALRIRKLNVLLQLSCNYDKHETQVMVIPTISSMKRYMTKSVKAVIVQSLWRKKKERLAGTSSWKLCKAAVPWTCTLWFHLYFPSSYGTTLPEHYVTTWQNCILFTGCEDWHSIE